MSARPPRGPPALLEAMDPKEKWQTMVGALEMVSMFAQCAGRSTPEAPTTSSRW